MRINPISSFTGQFQTHWRHWWSKQRPSRQDRLAFIGPFLAVILFLLVIVASFVYLRTEEMEREKESVRRDIEYAQQKIRLRLLDRQEQLTRWGRAIADGEIRAAQLQTLAMTMMQDFPEVASLAWFDQQKKLKSISLGIGAPENQHASDASARQQAFQSAFNLSRELKQSIYSYPWQFQSSDQPSSHYIQLHVPIIAHEKFTGVLVAEYSLDGIMRFAVPSEVTRRHAVSLLDDHHGMLSGQSIQYSRFNTSSLPWSSQSIEYSVPISPIGNSLVLRAQAFRTSQSLIGSALFWLVVALSLLTSWMLIGSWMHTRRRWQAQRALVAETNFRRAMENSILTGMRAMDLVGRITYVNAAFCQMTGWNESELVGCTPPYPYWHPDDHETMKDLLQQELGGKTSHSGIQMRVRRKDGSSFEARMYVSPLIDATGIQTGWMTSMTDITEPNRIREQLSASYERFTTVLEALDASVSVAPLGSTELLFTNKLYRQWFGHNSDGHMKMLERAGMPERQPDNQGDNVDDMAGFPAESLTNAQSEHAEIFITELDKWLEVRSRYLNWVDGRLAQMVIATDITPRRRAEELAELQAEKAEASSRLITMGEMASSVAHELNQPLTAITNYCNGMVSRIKNQQIQTTDLLQALEKTAHQAQRAGQIIQRIKSFVKRSEPNRTRAVVATLVNEAVELAEIELRRQQVKLSYFVSARLPKILVDPILIEQVIINLLKNAADSIVAAERPLHSRHIELQVLPHEIDGQLVVQFTVSDNGRGIAPEVMNRLFEAFYSTKTEGMGIGLNLCRSIVESHQGRMLAENIYNGADIRGCRFSFWIPVSEAAVSA